MEEATKEQEFLYHYTSIEGLKGIVENKTIRLTDYRFLNDPRELYLAVESFENYLLSQRGFSQEKDNKINKIIAFLQEIKTDSRVDLVVSGAEHNGNKILMYQKSTGSHVYIFSLTRKSDDLALWTMYGKGGVRLKLNKIKLEAFFDTFLRQNLLNGLTNIYEGDVKYDDFTPLYDWLIHFVGRDSVISQCYDTLYSVLVKVKDKSYEYEQEYRIGLNLSDDIIERNKKLKKIYVVKNEIFKPQVEFADFPIGEIIEDVIISPYNHSDCGVIGVKDFLKYYLKKDIPVTQSSIKVR